MAKSNKDIIIRVGANTAEFNKAMKGLNTNMASMQKGMADMGKMMAGAFTVGTILAASKAAIMSSEDQIKVNNKLLAALDGRVDIQQRLLAQAEEIRQKTGIDDNAIIEIQTFAAAQNRSEQQIKKNTEAAVQLAAATNVDLLSAMKAIDASMEGTIGKLGRLDKRFSDLSKTELENGAAVDIILEKYKGLAESQATELQLLSSNWEELQEQAGNALGKVINPLLKETNSLLNKLNSPDLNWMDKLNSLRGLNFESDFKMAVIQRKKDQVSNIEASDPFKAAVASKRAEMDNQFGYIPKAGSTAKAVKKPENINKEQKEKLTPEVDKISIQTQYEWALTEFNILNNEKIQAAEQARKDMDDSEMAALEESADAAYIIQKNRIDKQLTAELEAIQKQEEAKEKSVQLIADMNQMLSNAIINSTFAMGQSIADIITGDMGIEGLFNSILASLGDFLKQMGAAIMAYGITMAAFKKAFTNPVGAIAAGALLIITGSVITNLANKGAKMADGGVVPGGYPNDSYPAMLTSGETVIPAKKLPDFGAQKVEVYGVIRAGDIYLSNKRGEYLQWRKG